MEYQIAEETNVIFLSKEVDELLKAGWLPLGGVSVAAWYNSRLDEVQMTYCQAMVKNPEIAWMSEKASTGATL